MNGDDVTFDYQPPPGDLAILHADEALLVITDTTASAIISDGTEA